MSITITSGEVTLTPKLVLGYEAVRTAGNIVHPSVDNPAEVDVTFRPAGLRTGTLRMLFVTLADAVAAESLHANAGTVTLTNTDMPALSMTYVANGIIEVALDEVAQKSWIVSVDFQQV